MHPNAEQAKPHMPEPQVFVELEAYRSRALALEHQLFELRAALEGVSGVEPPKFKDR